MFSTGDFKDHADYVAKLIEAEGRERVIRAVAEVATYETIAGFKVKPMALFHYLALRDVMESPILTPFQSPSPVELAAFLWLLNPEYRRDGRGRARFLKTCRCFVPSSSIFSSVKSRKRAAARFVEVVTATREFVEEAMMDRPGSSGSESNDVEYYCDSVGITSILAREYGWSREAIMEMPMKIVFQHLKEIREYRSAVHGKSAALSNPSSQLGGRWLEQLNRRN